MIHCSTRYKLTTKKYNAFYRLTFVSLLISSLKCFRFFSDLRSNQCSIYPIFHLPSKYQKNTGQSPVSNNLKRREYFQNSLTIKSFFLKFLDLITLWHNCVFGYIYISSFSLFCFAHSYWIAILTWIHLASMRHQ